MANQICSSPIVTKILAYNNLDTQNHQIKIKELELVITDLSQVNFTCFNHVIAEDLKLILDLREAKLNHFATLPPGWGLNAS